MENLTNAVKKFMSHRTAFSVVAVVLYIALLVMFGLVFDSNSSADGNAWSSIVADALIIILCVSFMSLMDSWNPSVDEPKKFIMVEKSRKAVAFVVLMALAIYAAFGLSTMFAPTNNGFISFNKIESIPLIVLTVLIAPVCEEFLFRGVVFNNAIKTRLPIVAAAMLSAFVFAFLHGSYTSFAGTFVIGVFACASYVLLKSIYAPVLVHVIMNTAAVTLGGQSVPAIVFNPITSVIAGIVVFAVSVWFLAKLTKSESVSKR